MGSDNVHEEAPRRRRDREDYDDVATHSSKRSRHDHDRRRRRSRDREDRRRSRTPEHSSRRRRSRDRDRDGDRGYDRERHTHRDGDGRRHRDRERRDDKDSARDKRRHGERDKPKHTEDEDASDRKRSPLRRSGPLPTQEDAWAVTTGAEPEKPKEQANYGTTGRLAAASNSVAQADGTSVALKYHEPPEARKPSPKDQWKMYVFKGDDIVDTVDLGLRSCWLVGRDAAVVDLNAEHPSLSKQHAVIQFRYTEKRNEFGDKIGRVKPYLIDLESANGTTLNGDRVPDSRYLEIRDKDMVKFGHSTREYVFMLAPRQ